MKAEYERIPGQDRTQASRSPGAMLAARQERTSGQGAGADSTETLPPRPEPSEQQPQAAAGPETPADAVRDTD